MVSRYKEYFDAMPGYLTVQDRHFRIIDVNKRFREDFGDFEGRYCYQVYKNRVDRCEVCPVARTFRDGETHESEEQVRTLTGREVSVIVNTRPVHDETGEIVAVLEASTDITHSKNLQRLLRRSERRRRLMFDGTPCFITIQDADLNIVDANRAFQEAFGPSLGRKCYEACKHRSDPCPICPVQESFDDGQIHTREEVVTSLDGTHRNVLVTAAPIRNRRGNIAGVMELSADITQVRELEDRLTKLGLLIGSISHSLKGLLNGLAGGMYFVETGFQKNDRQRIEKGWATVSRNVGRIRSLVGGILYYAKDRIPNWETFAADEVARDVTTMLENRARELDVRLTTDIEPDAGQFEADPQTVRSMLVNLIENSLDACRLDEHKTSHTVHVRLRGLPAHVRFEIENNGIGMDRETCEKAFTLFFSSKGTGAGLGLFISDKIARAHGGTIDLESRPGLGTTFAVTLPRTRAAPPGTPEGPALVKEHFDAWSNQDRACRQ